LKNKTADVWVFWILFILTALYTIFVIIPMFPWVKWYNKLKSLRINRLKALSPISGLIGDQYLYSTLGKFSENLLRRRYSSKKIFRVYYGDSSGNEYWNGWFDMPIMDMPCFVEILAIHKANEDVDTKKRLHTLIQGSLPKTMIPDYIADAERQQIRIALRAAAQGNVPFFMGEDYVFLSKMTDNELSQGWKVENWPLIKKLSDVKLNPRKAFEWFAITSTYTNLLPNSLRKWLSKKIKNNN
jgi:hypothetical protein